MQGSNRKHLSMSLKHNTRLPVTVSAWLDSYRGGADPRTLLMKCLRQARDASPSATWIYLATDADLEKQLEALQAMVSGISGIDELIKRFPLYAIPYAVKDNIDIAGVPTTAACPAYRYVAGKSALVVQRLQSAGALWIGKSNLDQFATGLVGTRSPYGKPASVFSADHISGGSSSGSAVAVAAGLVPFALGTDTAGSGRVPAAFNQLVGLKPTPGRVSASGVVPACRTLDCVSVLALTVDDAAHVLAVIEGVDAGDSYSNFKPGPVDWKRSAGALRVGVPKVSRLEPDSEYAAQYGKALEHAKALGHAIVPVDFTALHRTADLLYSGPWVAERHTVAGELLKAAPDSIDPSVDPAVRSIILSADNFSAADAFRGQYELKQLQVETRSVWDEVDVLLVPTAPVHPRFTDIAEDPLGVNRMLGIYTNFVNLLGWCALALPAGTTAYGLPFGVTFIAPANHDVPIAALGREWQASIDLPLGGTGVKSGDAGMVTALRTPAVQKTLPVAVVGAHLSGMPLNGQLIERGARLLMKTTTAPHYRFYALPGTVPPKPGMVRVAAGGCGIEVEVWDLPLAHVGSFLALIPSPLALGSVELSNGQWVHGFLCESHAVTNAEDISRFGGWRSYMQSRAA